MHLLTHVGIQIDVTEGCGHDITEPSALAHHVAANAVHCEENVMDIHQRGQQHEQVYGVESQNTCATLRGHDVERRKAQVYVPGVQPRSAGLSTVIAERKPCGHGNHEVRFEQEAKDENSKPRQGRRGVTAEVENPGRWSCGFEAETQSTSLLSWSPTHTCIPKCAVARVSVVPAELESFSSRRSDVHKKKEFLTTAATTLIGETTISTTLRAQRVFTGDHNAEKVSCHKLLASISITPPMLAHHGTATVHHRNVPPHSACKSATVTLFQTELHVGRGEDQQ